MDASRGHTTGGGGETGLLQVLRPSSLAFHSLVNQIILLFFTDFSNSPAAIRMRVGLPSGENHMSEGINPFYAEE
jgi:hypothetical protein